MTTSLPDVGTTTRWLLWLELATAFLSVTTGGILFAFSSFVMPALRRLPAHDGIVAMQAINLEAPRSLLLVPLLGSAVGGAVLVIAALVRSSTPGRWLVIAGGILALVALVLTMAYHQPHNLALGRLDPNAPASASAWVAYVRGWTAWNHVRTASGLASGVLLVAALLQRR